MKKVCIAVLMGVVTFVGSSAFATGGGGVPSPFVQTSNRKVELADGEMYTLHGKVMFDDNDTPWFLIDLVKHPWLANAKRVQNPFYRLLGSRDEWRAYNGRAIQLICFAHGTVVDGTYQIVLSQVSEAGAKAVVPRVR